MKQSRVRPARADAIRNRANILDAARREITAYGPDVGMDQIATTAGVAVGTLYRHFPTKTDLVAAVVGAFMTQVADEAAAAVGRVEQGSTAFIELESLLHDIVRTAATNYAVKAAANALNAEIGDPADTRRASIALQSLIDAARTDRAVRDDLAIDDFYLLASNAPADPTPAALDRWVELILFGIAGPAQREFPARATGFQ